MSSNLITGEYLLHATKSPEFKLIRIMLVVKCVIITYLHRKSIPTLLMIFLEEMSFLGKEGNIVASFCLES